MADVEAEGSLSDPTHRMDVSQTLGQMLSDHLQAAAIAPLVPPEEFGIESSF
jgi:hypothetical protein